MLQSNRATISLGFGAAMTLTLIGLAWAQTAPTNSLPATTTSAAEGVTVDAAGNIYGAEVGPKRLMKYVRN